MILSFYYYLLVELVECYILSYILLYFGASWTLSRGGAPKYRIIFIAENESLKVNSLDKIEVDDIEFLLLSSCRTR